MSTWMTYQTNIERRYPIGHQFKTTIDRGDDNPHSIETVAVLGHFSDTINHESGVIVQTHDSMTTQISYAYLREDGSGH